MLAERQENESFSQGFVLFQWECQLCLLPSLGLCNANTLGSIPTKSSFNLARQVLKTKNHFTAHRSTPAHTVRDLPLWSSQELRSHRVCHSLSKYFLSCDKVLCFLSSLPKEKTLSGQCHVSLVRTAAQAVTSKDIIIRNVVALDKSA